jgi:hypothetical protein
MIDGTLKVSFMKCLRLLHTSITVGSDTQLKCV